MCASAPNTTLRSTRCSSTAAAEETVLLVLGARSSLAPHSCVWRDFFSLYFGKKLFVVTQQQLSSSIASCERTSNAYLYATHNNTDSVYLCYDWTSLLLCSLAAHAVGRTQRHPGCWVPMICTTCAEYLTKCRRCFSQKTEPVASPEQPDSGQAGARLFFHRAP